MPTWKLHFLKSFSFLGFQVTTKVTKPVDMPPPAKKPRVPAATPRSKPARLSVPWANGALSTPAPPVDASLAEINEENDDGEVETVEAGSDGANVYQQVRD